jgi:hypothetical protein
MAQTRKPKSLDAPNDSLLVITPDYIGVPGVTIGKFTLDYGSQGTIVSDQRC